MLNGYLKHSTASQSRMIGPFVDESTGKAETGLSIANTDIKLSKNGAAGVNKNSGGGTHRNNGMYSITFDATDTDTIGELCGSVDMESPIFADVVAFKFIVLKAEIYEALYSSTPTLLTSLDIGQLYESTIATVNSQVSFDMDGAIINDDAWIGNIVIINDISTNESVTRYVTDVDQTNDRIIINSAPPFTVVTNDILRVESRIHPSYALDVHSGPTIMHRTTINTLASQTSFTLVTGSTNDDAYNGCTAIITDATTATQKCVGIINNYVGSSKTITLDVDPGIFTIGISDFIDILPPVGAISFNGAEVVGDGSSGNKWRGN
jgi:hypothetical protein